MNKREGGFLLSRVQYPYTPHLVYGTAGNQIIARGTRSQLAPYTQSYEPHLSVDSTPSTSRPRFLHTPQTWSRSR